MPKPKSAIADLVGWVEMTKPNIAFISYLNISSLIKSEFSLRQREIERDSSKLIMRLSFLIVGLRSLTQPTRSAIALE